MRAILTLAGKDLRNLLNSPLYYVIAGLCAFIWSYSFMRSLFMFAEHSRLKMQAGMGAGMSLQQNVFLMHISQVNLLFIFFIPALTMRLLAEEKKMHTFDLLLTSPVSATQIAVGKFLAAFTGVAVLTGISFLYPLGTRIVVEYPMAPLFSAYLGLLLVSASYVAIGLFASSLTESVMLSVVMGLIFNILLWFISQGVGAEATSWYSPILEYLSLGQHFLGFIMGAIKLNAVVFLMSLTTLFLFLTQRVVESARWR